MDPESRERDTTIWLIYLNDKITSGNSIRTTSKPLVRIQVRIEINKQAKKKFKRKTKTKLNNLTLSLVDGTS